MRHAVYSLCGILLGALACTDRTIAGQLPLLGSDITMHRESFSGQDIVTSAVNGELRRYPFTPTLLQELQVRFKLF